MLRRIPASSAPSVAAPVQAKGVMLSHRADWSGSFATNSAARDPDRETTLVSTGLVASANLVRLAAFVERTANVQIPDRDIAAERFDTVGRIVAYVTERRGG